MWATPTMKSISIHALREEGDDHGFEIQPEAAIFLSTPSARRATPHRLGVVQGQPISIHALREEGDLELYGVPAANIRFLSTPSARRATALFGTSTMWPKYFYPRPPRGGRPTQSAASVPEKAISIHALREEGDLFSSTSTQMGRISIHALREEGDRAVSRMPSPYSRFLSTPSARRATRLDRSEYIGGYNFYPRPPRGGRRDVLLRAAAHSSEALGRLLVPARAGVAVALIHRARLLPPVLWAASAFSFADGAHLLHGEDGRVGRKGAKTPGVGL